MSRVKLSVPVTDLFREQADSLLPLADALELKWVREYDELPDREVIFHAGSGVIDVDFLPGLDREGAWAFLRRHRVRFYSFDLGPGCPRVVTRDGMYHPVGPVPSRRELLEIARPRIDRLRAGFDGDLGIENLNYFPTGAYEHVCEPAFITEFAEAFDLGLVVDIGHAMVSAYNLGMAARDYLLALPLGRLREIQVSRPTAQGGVARDAHECPGTEEFRLVEAVLARSGTPEVYLTVEYYRDGPALVRAYEELLARFGEGERPRGATVIAGPRP